jgi:hypothetical protein
VRHLRGKLVAGAAFGVMALAMAAPAAMAQQTTAAIGGVAVDDQDKPIANATVTVTHVPTGTKVTTITDGSGVFSLRGLRPGGPYRVTASAKNYEDQSLSDLYLNVADDSRVKLALVPAGSVSELVVTAAKSLTTSQLANVGSRTTIQAAQIESVVSVKRDVRDVARRDPLANLDLVSRSTGPSGGLYIAGSSPRRNRITIDGVRSQDDFGLNTGGLSTNRGPISLEAVEQVTIQATPFDVEEGDFTGGALNLILKSGGNDFHGSVFGFFRSPSLVGSTLPSYAFTGNSFSGSDIRNGAVQQTDIKITNYIHEKNYGGFISGPIWKDRLFFAASYENFTSFDLTSTGPSGGGYGATFLNLGAGTVAGGTGPATQANIDAITGLFKSPTFAGSFPPGTMVLAEPIVDQKYSVKIDFNVTNDQRLAFTYRHADSSVWKRSPSTSTISLNTNWYAQPEVEDNYALQLNSTWTPELSTEARVSYRDYTRGQTPPEGQGFANLSICTDPGSNTTINSTANLSCTSGSPTIQIGPDQFRQANELATTDWAGEFIANYRLGSDHRLKFGYQYKGIHIFDLFVQAAHGVYYFDSTGDFATGVASQVTFGSAVSGNVRDAAENFGYQTHTLLAQDTWDVNENLTLNYGLRVDIYKQSDKPTLNTAFQNRYGFTNQKTYDGQVVWQPRFSAKYRTPDFELSGGVGRVSGGIPDVFIGNSYGAQTGALSGSVSVKRVFTSLNSYNYVDSNNNPFNLADGDALLGKLSGYNGYAGANVPTTATFGTSTPSSIQSLISNTSTSVAHLAFTNSIAPDFKMPADWKANISFKTTKFGLDFGVDAVYSRSDTNIAFRDIRARALTINGVQQFTPDGRMRYDGLNIAAATRTANGLPTSSNPDLANSVGNFGDIQAFNPSKQNWAATVAFSVGKRWKGFDAFLSYTYQDARSFGGISEFGTTEGGNGATGNYYADQGSFTDPNGAVYGIAPNLIRNSWKLDLSYKVELVKGFTSHFTLFAESHSGRPLSFLMTDPSGSSGRSIAFGVWRDDQLAYIPQLGTPTSPGGLTFDTPNAAAPGGTTRVVFDSQASLDKFRAVVSQFGLPLGAVVPRGFGQNPQVNRVDFQFAQEFPSPIKGHELLFTMDISNLGNLLNHNWGVVKEYGGLTSRAGTPIINVQCADASGVAASNTSTTCAAYRYSYSGTANPTTAATPFVDAQASQWSIQFGLKYKF